MRSSVGASASTLGGLAREAKLLMRLRHPRIVLLLGCTTHHGQFTLVLEWMERGSLFDMLHKGEGTMTTREKLRVAKDVADGMVYVVCIAYYYHTLHAVNASHYVASYTSS